jgi:hypothetical protein
MRPTRTLKFLNSRTANLFHLHFVLKRSQHVFNTQCKNAIFTTVQRQIPKLFVCILIFSILKSTSVCNGGTRRHSWLRNSAASRKVAGSNPDEVTGFFTWPTPSSRTMALGSTQLLTEMSTRNLPGGKVRPGRKTDNLTAICRSII